jgi:hypothetical protein
VTRTHSCAGTMSSGSVHRSSITRSTSAQYGQSRCSTSISTSQRGRCQRAVVAVGLGAGLPPPRLLPGRIRRVLRGLSALGSSIMVPNAATTVSRLTAEKRPPVTPDRSKSLGTNNKKLPPRKTARIHGKSFSLFATGTRSSQKFVSSILTSRLNRVRPYGIRASREVLRC